MPMTLEKLNEIIIAHDQKNMGHTDHLSIQAIKLFHEQHQHQLHLNLAQEWLLLQCFLNNQPNHDCDYSAVFAYIACIEILCAAYQGIEPWRWLQVMNVLHQQQLFNRETFDTIKQHPNLSQLIDAIMELHASKLCDQANFEVILNHLDTQAVATALCQLAEAGLLNESVRHALEQHAKPVALAASFKLLAAVNINTAVNREHLMATENAWYIAMSLDFLSRANMLNQAIFGRLFLPQHKWLLSNEARLHVWYQLNEEQFTAQMFEDLLACARSADPCTAAIDYFSSGDSFDTNFTQGSEAFTFNDSESTHIASVHKTASESAFKLFHRYGASLSSQALLEVSNQAVLWVISRYDDNEKVQAALRGILYLIENNDSYTEPVSMLSITTLVALVWLAIHDERCRIGTLEDALAMFLEGLYEIQRGNNLSAAGVDDGMVDERICDPGIFNKLIEKLQSIHPDCVMHFLTEQTAALKLPRVVKEELMRYLLLRAKATSYQEAVAFATLITTLGREGLIQIWLNVQPRISARLFEEFGSLYRDDPADPKFIAFIQSGQEVDLGDLSPLQQELQGSKGYQSYCSGALWTPNFFKPRHVVVATGELFATVAECSPLRLGA